MPGSLRVRSNGGCGASEPFGACGNPAIDGPKLPLVRRALECRVCAGKPTRRPGLSVSLSRHFSPFVSKTRPLCAGVSARRSVSHHLDVPGGRSFDGDREGLVQAVKDTGKVLISKCGADQKVCIDARG